MIDRLTGVEDRFVEVEKLLSDPEIIQDAQQRFGVGPDAVGNRPAYGRDTQEEQCAAPEDERDREDILH